MTAVFASPAVLDVSAPYVEKRSNAQRNRARVHKRWFFRGLKCSGGPPGLAEELHQQASNWILQPRGTAALNIGVPDSSPGQQHCAQAFSESEAETTDSDRDDVEGILKFTAAVQEQRMYHYDLESAEISLESCYASKSGTARPVQKESLISASSKDFMFPGLSYLTYSDAEQLSAVSISHAAFLYQLEVGDAATFPNNSVIEELPGAAVNSQGCLTSRELNRLNNNIIDLAMQEDVSDPVLNRLQHFWFSHPWCIP